MNSEDRKFIKGLITGLDRKITGLENTVDQKITGLESSLDQKITGLESSLDQKITGLDRKMMAMGVNLEKQIRHNGVLIERMQDDIGQMKEGFSVFGKNLNQAMGDIADIKETIHDYPILRETVKKHSRQLTELGR